MNVRKPALGLLCAVGLLVVSCGGGPAASSESGASLVRSDALAYVSVDTDLGSGQWKQVDELSQKFPGRELALSKLEKALGKHGVGFENDVEPALGPEVDVAVVSAGTEDTTKVVGLTQPQDPAKLVALIGKLNADSSGKPVVYRELDYGWYAVGESQAAIDQALAGDGPKLENDSTYTDALSKLPDEALVQAYVNGQQLAQLAASAAKNASGSPFGSQVAALRELDSISASLSAEDDGVSVHGVAKGAGAEAILDGSDFSSKLLENAPGDALAFLTFRGGSGLATSLQSLGAPITAMLGISVDELASLLENEVALYVRPGIGIPEITLALDAPNTVDSLKTLDKLAASVAAMTGGKVTENGSEKTLTIGSVAIHYGTADGKVVVTTASDGVGAYGGSDDRLADSADFKEAKSAAGMPDSNAGFAYIDLKDAIPLLLGIAGLAGSQPSPVVTENLRPLRSLLAWSEGQGDTRTFDLFLEIK
jgi:Protein of unknown function (DUF3352)